MSATLQVGTVLHGPEQDYKILKVLGQGGFGITYLAETDFVIKNISIKGRVAIKEHFISSLCSRDGATHSVSYSEPVAKEVQNSLRAFVKEARRLHDLGISHPNIVKVNEVFEANNTAYYVMQYLDGESLDAYVKRAGALSESEARELLLPLVHAVSQLHRNKVAHYDIKPQNIMLAKDENGELQPTLIDFGLAKHYDNQGHATSSIMAAGYTPGYAPIEQYIGISEYTPQSDVYALGATLYYTLTGNHPAVASLLKTAQVSVDLDGRCSDNMRRVILRALQKEVEDRYPDATRMFDDLCGDGYDSGATVKKPKPRVTPEPTRPQPRIQAEEVETIIDPSPRFDIKKIGIFVGAFLLGVLGVWLLPLGGGDSGESTDEDTTRVDTILSEVRDTVYVDRIVDSPIAQPTDKPESAEKTPSTSTVNQETTKQPSEPPVVREDPRTEQPSAKQPEPKPEPVQPKPEPVQPAQPEPKPTTGYINGHEYVDLGLSVKWATCNVGASSPSGYGNYYAWGETSTKSEYTGSNSKTYGNSSYGNIGGSYSTDAARANWGGSWRLPTKAECEELKDRCTWTWTTQGGHNGYKVKGPNGNTIFLPAAGFRNGSSLSYAGEYGNYWSSTPDSASGGAYGLYFDSSGRTVGWYHRCNGFSVRPVSE